jgi:hypothetical protein
VDDDLAGAVHEDARGFPGPESGLFHDVRQPDADVAAIPAGVRLWYGMASDGMKFRRRISAGSSASARAAMSTMRSRTNVASKRPGAR